MSPISLEKRFRCLSRLIGNTPLLAIHLKWKGVHRVIHAKAEHYNLTGSIKDRMALNIMRRAYACGALKPGDMLVEATSGNTGIAFAALGRMLGHRVRIHMPDWMSDERKALMRSLGAELQLFSREDGGFLGSIAAAQELARENSDVFLPDQFANPDNCEAHENGTGRELIGQIASLGLTLDGFVAGVGTGGTIMGVGRALQSQFPCVHVHPVEPLESPTLSTGYKVGSHRIQGISDDFIPAVVDLAQLGPVLAVSDGDAIIMAQRLAAELGLGIGISSGANLIAALMAQDRLSPDAVVATVFSDDNKKYLSTDLARVEPLRAGYIAPEVELIGVDAVEPSRIAEALPEPIAA
ncbi:MAG: PLP-dependent cysteine synthase family protein [Proteobacteria bacterium]|nr:PLP-dependent cysteine synthase family protein [Pseudomonadota bacterium]